MALKMDTIRLIDKMDHLFRRLVENHGASARQLTAIRHFVPLGRIAAGIVITAPLALGIALSAEAPRSNNIPVRITVEAKPIDSFLYSDPDRHRFGMLEYLGGIELTSSHRDFGGLSAMRVESDGMHFVSLSDHGRWFTGRIVYDGGRPSGIADALMAPMLGPDGRTLASRGWYDTESLAEQDGMLYVGIERVNRIVRFDFAKFGVLARADVIPVPLGISKLPGNKGLEALAFAPRTSRLAGALMAFSERGLDSYGNLKAFLLGGAAPGEFTVKRRDDFDISDCAILPSGDVLLLERRFTWLSGIAIRLRRIAIADIAPGAIVDGPVVMSADMRYQIDNMEGLSIHRDPDGSTILTMISDDNFFFLQRTILLQFKLVED
jgi:hypothetical protein